MNLEALALDMVEPEKAEDLTGKNNLVVWFLEFFFLMWFLDYFPHIQNVFRNRNKQLLIFAFPSYLFCFIIQPDK